MNKYDMHLSRTQLLWLFLIALGLMRFASLAIFPLMDTTEARYGEIARIMVETNNWVTPQIDYDVPYWGKPPLYVWASASSIFVFGNSEFSLRLPYFLSAVLVLILIWQFVTHLKLSRAKASHAVALVASTFGFLIAAGLVMTDMLLCLSMVMSMTGFWRGWHGERVYNYLMYAGLGVGLLAKGPVIIVLVGLVLFLWLVVEYGLRRMWLQIWLRMNIFSGLIFMLLISAPWYILAEHATPGFLEYFFIGEHFQRFINSGWQGDLYGLAHPKAKGTILVYWFLYALPWSPFIIWGVVKYFYSQKTHNESNAGLNLFLSLWMCSPMLLFTFAGNVLPSYILPGLPAIGLLIAFNYDIFNIKKRHVLFLTGAYVLLIAIIMVSAIPVINDRSDKDLLYIAIDSDYPLYYYRSRAFSAKYYSNGKVKVVENLPDDKRYYLAIHKTWGLKELEQLCQLTSENRKNALYFCNRDNL